MDKMRMEWIGTGSGFNGNLGNTGILITGNGGRKLLVDCGILTPHRLLEKDILKDITDIVITHLHSDHIGGLENLACMNLYVYDKRDEKRPYLHIASQSMAHDLWEYSLKGGMRCSEDKDGKHLKADIHHYFRLRVGNTITVPGIPSITMIAKAHVLNMENYGLAFSNGVYYSGDTIELPPHNGGWKVVFQDCQFVKGKTNVHALWENLIKEPDSVKRRTYLVHLGRGHEKYNAKAAGFAGFVMPGDKFEF